MFLSELSEDLATFIRSVKQASGRPAVPEWIWKPQVAAPASDPNVAKAVQRFFNPSLLQ